MVHIDLGGQENLDGLEVSALTSGYEGVPPKRLRNEKSGPFAIIRRIIAVRPSAQILCELRCCRRPITLAPWQPSRSASAVQLSLHNGKWYDFRSLTAEEVDGRMTPH